MNKRHLHHIWTRLRPISHWYFLAATVLMLIVGVQALRQNNLMALSLRDKVIATDEHNGDVEAALRELRAYVHSHMNTSLSSGPNAIKPPIQLKYRYERLVEAEKERVSQHNERIYTDAQNICEQRFPAGLGGRGRIPCIEDYVSKNGIKEQPIPDALYKFDFVSPRWSPDLAGFSLLLSVFSFLLFLVRFGLERWFRHQFRD